jgi:hypothetical protein
LASAGGVLTSAPPPASGVLEVVASGVPLRSLGSYGLSCEGGTTKLWQTPATHVSTAEHEALSQSA